MINYIIYQFQQFISLSLQISYSKLVRDLEYQDLQSDIDLNQENTFICQNIKPLGNSLFLVQLPKEITKTPYTVQLPQKFNKKILFGRQDLCVAHFLPDFLQDPNSIGVIDMLINKENFKKLQKQGKLEEYGFVVEEETVYENIKIEELLCKEESSPSYY